MSLAVTGPHGRGTALRLLASVLGDVDVASAPGPLSADAVLDLRTGTVRTAGRVVRVVLTVPREGEVGVVEDLLVDRAFADVAGEATALASLADVTATTLDELRWQLGAAALARAAGATADEVGAGLARCRPDPHRHLQVVDGVAWVEDTAADPRGLLSYDRVVWVVRAGAALNPPDLHHPGLRHPGLHHPGLHHPELGHPGLGQPGLGRPVDRLRAVVVLGAAHEAEALQRHAPDVPVLTALASDTEAVTSTDATSTDAISTDGGPCALALARSAARADDTVLLAVPGLAASVR